MTPTILVGDFLYVHRVAPDDIVSVVGSLVVFDSPEEPGLLVLKRIVAGPGDTIRMDAGILRRNGVPVQEPYVLHEAPGRRESSEHREKMRRWQIPYVLGPDTATYHPDLSDWGPLVAPPESFFLLGDNREASYDSRYVGWVNRARFVGTPGLIYYSFDPFAASPLPAVTAIRWERLGLHF
jgi:signal peptidase I